MDAAVHEQPLEGTLCHLAADRVETRHDDGLWRVVDDEIDTGERLEGADVPALTADDPPLHVIARKRHDGHGVLGGVFGGVPLQRHRDDLASAGVSGLPRLLLEVVHLAIRDVAHLVLDALQEEPTRFVHRKARHPGELGPLLALQLDDLLALGFKIQLLLHQATLPLVYRGELLVELFVLLVQPRLVALQLRAALPVLGLRRLGERDGLVLGLEEDLLLLRAGLRNEALPIRTRSRLAAEREGTADQEASGEADEASDEGHKAHDEGVGHLKFLSVWREREDARRAGANAPLIA